jgi:hypothetical protein
MTDTPIAAPKLDVPGLLMTLLLRLTALGCLWFAVLIWGDLIGYRHGGRLRFDLLGADIKAANATLAVLYPVAAIGLWLRGAWGPVLWAVAGCMEVAMHQMFVETFGPDPVRIAIVAATAIAYLVLRAVMLFLKPARSRTIQA